MTWKYPEDQAKRFVKGMNVVIDACNDLSVIHGMSDREILSVLSVVSIEVAKQGGDISRKDFVEMTRHMASDAKKHLS